MVHVPLLHCVKCIYCARNNTFLLPQRSVSWQFINYERLDLQQKSTPVTYVITTYTLQNRFLQQIGYIH